MRNKSKKIGLICFSTLFLLSLSPGVYSLPSSVTIIRHAEKEESSRCISSTGWSRAGALIGLFGGMLRISDVPELDLSSTLSIFPPPFAIFAAQPESTTIRPLQTVIPLAKSLNLPINTEYSRAAFVQLAHHIATHPEYDSQQIFVALSHGKIPSFVSALIEQVGGVKLDLAPYPHDRYDLVYVIDFGNKAITLDKRDARVQSISPSLFLTVTVQKLMFCDPDTLPPAPFPLNPKKD